ncbi:MAG: hypothetical protein EYC69_08380 [Bacteroidetes bacterium]|nr:MAG: hypothetical protein EYC69_08380 [Bacteroidota bacterium]
MGKLELGSEIEKLKKIRIRLENIRSEDSYSFFSLYKIFVDTMNESLPLSANFAFRDLNTQVFIADGLKLEHFKYKIKSDEARFQNLKRRGLLGIDSIIMQLEQELSNEP